MSEAALAIPAEPYERLQEENEILRDRLATYERVLRNLDSSEAKVLLLERAVARQRAQLRQQNDAFWRKRQANRVLRSHVEAMSERLREVDQEWLEKYRGKNS